MEEHKDKQDNKVPLTKQEYLKQKKELGLPTNALDEFLKSIGSLPERKPK
jgi:hypothetical protein|tara:strand:- start:102 stop:251 length:150 start_codon:yes stop_codon:yes gene_type:complete